MRGIKTIPEMLIADFWAKPETDVAPRERSVIQSQIVEQGRVRDLADMTMDRVSTEPLDVPNAYFLDGTEVPAAHKQEIQANAKVHAANVQYGLSVCYASIRSWPTDELLYADEVLHTVEVGQHSALHSFEPVRILGQSADGLWYFIRSTTCDGWVKNEHIAVCDESAFFQRLTEDHFLVVCGRGVTVEPNGHDQQEPIPVEFGAWIPLSEQDLHTWQYRVMIPRRASDGRCEFTAGSVPLSGAVSEGFLPLTRHSVVKSALTLLGDRYGWGSSMGRRDCSSYIMDVYRTLGIQLPRNSRAQKESLPLRIAGHPDPTHRAYAGDVLYLPGHVMLYLGTYQETEYAVHAFVGYRPDLDSLPVVCHQVMITPLDLYMRREPKTYLESVTSTHYIL